MNSNTLRMLEKFSETAEPTQVSKEIIDFFIDAADLKKVTDFKAEMEKISFKKSSLSSMQRKILPMILKLQDKFEQANVTVNNDTLGGSDNSMNTINANVVNTFSEQINSLKQEKVEADPFKE